ncbi:hypothetical protein [Paenibacillus etheri]|jgi:hypothetical protein|uniref:Uncharacterized protein n=1 Tax=Paenibacillus etheri TaxID=1306852 RepID=A0A0W1AUN5_9BACL|nr:hypothetical protein [Paenibacillus etheri]KTD85032.1 hypothetical protein UQ64_22580 [Paenibacillus etheri]
MFVTYCKQNDKIGRVDMIYSNPDDFDLSGTDGFDVDEIPEANTVPGTYSVLMVKLPSNELYYDYIAIQTSNSLEQLINENTLLKSQVKAHSERSDFIEDVISELATQLYK